MLIIVLSPFYFFYFLFSEVAPSGEAAYLRTFDDK